MLNEGDEMHKLGIILKDGQKRVKCEGKESFERSAVQHRHLIL